MKTEGKTALVLGATGLTGVHLLQLLLHDARYDKITTLARSPLGVAHQKLVAIQGDLLQLQEESALFRVDDVFCCIGTTTAKTPDKQGYRAIDFGIPVTAARLAKEEGALCLVVMSALGANAKSSLFYPRVKGEMEEAVLGQNLHRTFILQPALIGGHREEARRGEYLVKKLMGALNFLLVGPLRKYRVIAPEAIAQAMIWLANHTYGEARIPSDTIAKLAKAYGKTGS